MSNLLFQICKLTSAIIPNIWICCYRATVFTHSSLLTQLSKYLSSDMSFSCSSSSKFSTILPCKVAGYFTPVPGIISYRWVKVMENPCWKSIRIGKNKTKPILLMVYQARCLSSKGKWTKLLSLTAFLKQDTAPPSQHLYLYLDTKKNYCPVRSND